MKETLIDILITLIVFAGIIAVGIMVVDMNKVNDNLKIERNIKCN